jgi:hypothetical protein
MEPSPELHEKDLEASKGPSNSVTPNTYTEIRRGSINEEVARTRHIQNTIKPLRYLRRGEEWLDEKMGIETQGIDRIPDEEKRPPSIFNSFFIWWSMTCHVGTLPIGFLGPEFGLSLNQSVAAIVVGTFLGALCTTFCGTLGPKVRAYLPSAMEITHLFPSSAFARLLLRDTHLVSGVLRSAQSSTLSFAPVLLLSTSSFVVKCSAPSPITH